MNKYKVQVIEDEINICNFMKMIFETHEYQAIFSQRGESGLTMFWSHHPSHTKDGTISGCRDRD